MALPKAHRCHRLSWAQLSTAQLEDEKRQQRGSFKHMPWLYRSKHIKRTSYAALKVGLAIDILAKRTADMLRLRRHGGWRTRSEIAKS